MEAAQPLNWILSFSDPTTGINIVPQSLTTGDVFGDGNYRTLFTTMEQKLICFEGSRMTHEIVLPELASSICIHYSGKAVASLPLVAVGAGDSLYFFLNLRQFSKFTLPLAFKSSDEQVLYEKTREEEPIEIEELAHRLKSLQNQQIPLSQLSQILIKSDLKDSAIKSRLEAAVSDMFLGDCITALSTMRINVMSDNFSTRLFIGTESGMLYLLNNHDNGIEKQWDLGNSPSAIRCSGYYSGVSIIAIISRDRNIRLISNLSKSVITIRCDSLPVDVAIVGEQIYVALMSRVVKIYDTTGVLVDSIPFDEHIVSISSMDIDSRQVILCAVATASGDVHFIKGDSVVSSEVFEEGISAMLYGRVGREPHNILTISKHGGFYLRSLSRLTRETKTQKEQEAVQEPIPIPRQNKLFLEQCEKEKNNGQQMYEEWMNSVRFLNMVAIDTYATSIEKSVLSPSEDVSFICRVHGAGPQFLLKATTSNSGKTPVSGVVLIPSYEKDLYKVCPSQISLPTLQAGASYIATFEVTSVDRDGKTGAVTLVGVSPQFTIPLCTSVVQMPVSQFSIE